MGVPLHRTHCPHGHEYTEANTYYRKARPTTKQCRECARIQSRKCDYAARRQRRRVSGLCPECGWRPLAPRLRKCQHCTNVVAARVQRWQARQAERGLCSRCLLPALPDKRVCAKHLAATERHNQRRRMRTKLQQAKLPAHACSNLPLHDLDAESLEKGYVTCADCRQVKRDHHRRVRALARKRPRARPGPRAPAAVLLHLVGLGQLAAAAGPGAADGDLLQH